MSANRGERPDAEHPRSGHEPIVVGDNSFYHRPRPLFGVLGLHQMSIFSAISIASSTLIPRYLTVLSVFVRPSKSWTARRLPVRRHCPAKPGISVGAADLGQRRTVRLWRSAAPVRTGRSSLKQSSKKAATRGTLRKSRCVSRYIGWRAPSKTCGYVGKRQHG